MRDDASSLTAVIPALLRAAHQIFDARPLILDDPVQSMDDVHIDVLAERLGSTRGAIYKTLHDARGKLRRVLADAGYEDDAA